MLAEVQKCINPLEALSLKGLIPALIALKMQNKCKKGLVSAGTP